MLFIYVPSETDLQIGETLLIIGIGEREIKNGSVVRRIELFAQQGVKSDGAICPRCEHPLNMNWHHCAECGEVVPRR